MATEYATLVFKADTQEIGEAYNQLKKLNQQGKVTDKTLQSFEKQMKGIRPAASGAGKSFGGMGRQAGQAGIQIQQLVGQVQAGTNPMVALSQQAADLGIVLGLPLLGAVAGIAAAFAGPFISAITGSSDAIRNQVDAIKELEKAFNDLGAAQRQALIISEERAIEDQIDLIERLNRQANTLNETRTREVALNNGIVVQTDEIIEKTQAEKDEIVALNAEREQAIIDLGEMEKRLGQMLGTIPRVAEKERDAANAADQFGESIARQIDTFGKSKAEILRYEASLLDLNNEQMAQVEILAELIEKKEADAEATRKQAENEEFLVRLRKAAIQKTEQLRKEEEQKQKERIAKEMADRQAADQAVLERMQEMQAAESELRAQGLLEEEVGRNSSYEKRLAKLREFKEKELITEKQYAEAKKNLDKQTQQIAIDSVGDAFNALAQHNEKAFKLAKAYNIGLAIMNTYTGASNALKELPPPLNFIVAAATVAAGLAQVQQIRSQQYSGRALGGQVRSGESYVVGERGPEVLTMGNNGRIIPNDKLSAPSQTNNQNVSVSFNITATDASGFDQLLQARRGMIIGMINQAMNNRGRKALV